MTTIYMRKAVAAIALATMMFAGFSFTHSTDSQAGESEWIFRIYYNQCD